MATVRKLKDPAVLNAPTPKPREVSPQALARQRENEKIRTLVRSLNSPSQVFEIALEPDDKALTVRNRLLRLAGQEGKEIVVRKYGAGFAVGLMTPERRSKRGRPRKYAEDHPSTSGKS